jgi:hypothetical protein
MQDDRTYTDDHTQPDRLPAWPQNLGANGIHNELDQSSSSRITGESIDQDKKDSAAGVDPEIQLMTASVGPAFSRRDNPEAMTVRTIDSIEYLARLSDKYELIQHRRRIQQA